MSSFVYGESSLYDIFGIVAFFLFGKFTDVRAVFIGIVSRRVDAIHQEVGGVSVVHGSGSVKEEGPREEEVPLGFGRVTAEGGEDSLYLSVEFFATSIRTRVIRRRCDMAYAMSREIVPDFSGHELGTIVGDEFERFPERVLNFME